MGKNTVSYLNTKIWYRFIKVIYIFFYVLGLLIGFGVGIEEIPYDGWLEGIGMSLAGGIGIILFFELIKHSFYYIVLGNFFPKDGNATNLKEKITNNKKQILQLFNFLKEKLSNNKKVILKTIGVLIIIFFVIAIEFGANSYWYKYNKEKNIKLFREKFTNIEIPKTANSFKELYNEIIIYSKNNDISTEEKYNMAERIANTFQEQYPIEAIKVGFNNSFNKNGLYFEYPDELELTEQDANQFSGFFNVSGFSAREKEYGQIVVSILNEKEKIDDCVGELKERLSPESRFIYNGRVNTRDEQIMENKKMIDDATVSWNQFFKEISDGINKSDSKDTYSETYTCGYAGSNFAIQPIKVSVKNGVVIHKSISQVSKSACTFNTQVLIPKDENNFYQIGFTYNFGEFKNDCKGFDVGYPEPQTPFSDSTDLEWETLQSMMQNEEYFDSGKFYNFSKNKMIIDAIISTISLK